ncbi:MAG: endolytic transglycosylase MltG [Blautia sp.]|nr:endolytic transglycosylase MltG [Blautia sp.]MCM1201294.1 endolytic transglycosylase MltG [Bacteroides fragilis]
MDIKQVIGSVVETIIKVAAVFFLVSFVYDAAVKAYDFGFRVFAEEAMTTGEGRIISIYVEPDDSVRDIGNTLEEKGLIRDADLFFVQELLSEHHGKINPGIYDLSTSMKSDEMLAIMAAEPEETEEGDKDKGSSGEGSGDMAEDSENAGEDGGAEDPDAAEEQSAAEEQGL